MSERKLKSHVPTLDPNDENYTRRGTPSPLPDYHPLNSGAMKSHLVWTQTAKARMKKAMLKGEGDVDETIGSEENE